MYTCTCEEDCHEQKQVICEMNPELNDRQGCKYCRYLRCLEAGMVAQMVIKDTSESNFKPKKKPKALIAKNIEKARNINENELTTRYSFNTAKSQGSSPTKIIDIAEKFRQRLPFWNSDVNTFYYYFTDILIICIISSGNLLIFECWLLFFFRKSKILDHDSSPTINCSGQ